MGYLVIRCCIDFLFPGINYLDESYLGHCRRDEYRLFGDDLLVVLSGILSLCTGVSCRRQTDTLDPKDWNRGS